MINKINLKWAKPLNGAYFNFGDDVNPYLIEKLSGSKVRYIHFATDRVNTFKQFIIGLKQNFSNPKYYSYFIRSLVLEKYVLGIGSILNWYGSRRCFVWGSGIIDRTSPIKNSTFLAVRGKYTEKRLRELGYNANVVLGDPALLLPLVYLSNVKKEYELGIAPHHSQYEEVKSKLGHIKGLVVLNLNNSDVERVIDDFVVCKRIVSTSLHGLIVANAYGIDALWFEVKNKPLTKDNVKFLDYFSSVDIPEYTPFTLDFDHFDLAKYMSLVDCNSAINNIKNNLNTIQRDLVRVAPFAVKKSFLKQKNQ